MGEDIAWTLVLCNYLDGNLMLYEDAVPNIMLEFICEPKERLDENKNYLL